MSGRIGLKAQRLLAKRLHPALAFLASAGGISAQKGELQMGCPPAVWCIAEDHHPFKSIQSTFQFARS